MKQWNVTTLLLMATVQGCPSHYDDCTRNGMCVGGTRSGTGAAGAGGSTGNTSGSGGAPVGCQGDPDCDDGNPCTIDACNGNGTCGRADAATGQVVGGTTCLPVACAGGAPAEEAAAAGTPCDGGFCDGVGACQPPLALGGGCQVDAQCGSGHCVEGACCMFACDSECAMCKPGTFDDCVLHTTGDHDPECGEDTQCVGGQCMPNSG